MMFRFIRVAMMLFAFIICFTSAALARTWKSAGGTFSVEAEFEGLEGETVVLKKNDGKLLRVMLSKLSEADRNHVRMLVAAQTPAWTITEIKAAYIESIVNRGGERRAKAGNQLLQIQGRFEAADASRRKIPLGAIVLVPAGESSPVKEAPSLFVAAGVLGNNGQPVFAFPEQTTPGQLSDSLKGKSGAISFGWDPRGNSTGLVIGEGSNELALVLEIPKAKSRSYTLKFGNVSVDVPAPE